MVIGQGLVIVINCVKESEVMSKVIILFIDGVNNAGYLFLDMVVDIVKEFVIKVYIIGVGFEGEVLMLVSKDCFGCYCYDVVCVEIDE